MLPSSPPSPPQSAASPSAAGGGPAAHFLSIHILRGLAALLVVCEHIVGRPPYAGFNELFAGLDGLGRLGVACFFVISGFVLPRSLGSFYRLAHFPRFMARRALRIEPTYLASILITCLAVMGLTRLAPHATPWQPSLSLLVQHVFYVVPFTESQWLSGVYWTLAVEFQFYLTLGLLFPVVLAASRLASWLGPLLVGSFSLLVFTSPAWPELQLLKYSPYFSFGLLLERHFQRPMPMTVLIVYLAGVSALAIAAGTPASDCSACLLTVAVILLWRPSVQGLGAAGPVLRFLGTISYSWYVIHQLIAGIGETTARFLASRPPFPLQSLAVNSVPLLSFAGGVVAATLLHRLVEEPTHRWARRLRLQHDG